MTSENLVPFLKSNDRMHAEKCLIIPIEISYLKFQPGQNQIYLHDTAYMYLVLIDKLISNGKNFRDGILTVNSSAGLNLTGAHVKYNCMDEIREFLVNNVIIFIDLVMCNDVSISIAYFCALFLFYFTYITYIIIYLHFYVNACMPASLNACMSECLNACLIFCLNACLNPC